MFNQHSDLVSNYSEEQVEEKSVCCGYVDYFRYFAFWISQRHINHHLYYVVILGHAIFYG